MGHQWVNGVFDRLLVALLIEGRAENNKDVNARMTSIKNFSMLLKIRSRKLFHHRFNVTQLLFIAESSYVLNYLVFT